MNEPIEVRHLQALKDYVIAHGSVTNRECCKLTGLGQEGSTKAVEALCALGVLRKVGEASATKYVLPNESKAETNRTPEQTTIKHLEEIMTYVAKNGSITNREFRGLTALSYNCAIRTFGILCSLGILNKTGANSATK